MNVVGSSLGGVPMCHGAGGMAAHVRFGARTGGALVILGSIMLVLGLFFADSIATFLSSSSRPPGRHSHVWRAGTGRRCASQPCLEGGSLRDVPHRWGVYVEYGRGVSRRSAAVVCLPTQMAQSLKHQTLFYPLPSPGKSQIAELVQAMLKAVLIAVHARCQCFQCFM